MPLWLGGERHNPTHHVILNSFQDPFVVGHIVGDGVLRIPDVRLGTPSLSRHPAAPWTLKRVQGDE
jgi:hypothetical protein